GPRRLAQARHEPPEARRSREGKGVLRSPRPVVPAERRVASHSARDHPGRDAARARLRGPSMIRTPTRASHAAVAWLVSSASVLLPRAAAAQAGPAPASTEGA